MITASADSPISIIVPVHCREGHIVRPHGTKKGAEDRQHPSYVPPYVHPVVSGGLEIYKTSQSERKGRNVERVVVVKSKDQCQEDGGLRWRAGV